MCHTDIIIIQQIVITPSLPIFVEQGDMLCFSVRMDVTKYFCISLVFFLFSSHYLDYSATVKLSLDDEYQFSLSLIPYRPSTARVTALQFANLKHKRLGVGKKAYVNNKRKHIHFFMIYISAKYDNESSTSISFQ